MGLDLAKMANRMRKQKGSQAPPLARTKLIIWYKRLSSLLIFLLKGHSQSWVLLIDGTRTWLPLKIELVSLSTSDHV